MRSKCDETASLIKRTAQKRKIRKNKKYKTERSEETVQAIVRELKEGVNAVKVSQKWRKT